MRDYKNKISLIQIVAALMIVNHHTSVLNIPIAKYFTKGGFVYNTIFVFISGYLLANSTLHNENISFYKFISKRIMRIYPSLHISLIFTVVIFYIIGKEVGIYPLIITFTGFQYFFDISNYGVQLWFISVILVCYFLFIPTFFCLKNKPYHYFFGVIIIFIFIALWQGDFTNDFYRKVTNDIMYRLLYHYIIFCLGILTLLKINKLELFNIRKAIFIGIGSFIIYILSIPYNKYGIITLLTAVLSALSGITIISYFFDIIYNKVPWLFFLSQITYEIYLIHVTIIIVMKEFYPGKFIGYLMVYILSILLAILISKISYKYSSLIKNIT